MRPTRTVNGETREWNGTAWVPAGSNTGGPTAPMMSMPAPGPSHRSDADDMELLKQLLTTGGTVAGGLAGGIPGAIIGGAGGRMLGHTPEALTTAATGQPNDSSFGGDAALGSMEGLTQELLPKFAGRIIGAGGTGLKYLGKALFDNPDAGYRTRALMGLFRSYAARPLGGTAEAVAAMGPMVASEAGTRLERAGANMGTGTLSERVGGGLDALKARLTAEPPLTRADRLAVGAERYSGARRADALQEAAAQRGSGLEANFREYTPDIPPSTRPPVVPATDIYGDPHGLEDLTNLYHESVGAGMEPNAASRIVLGESRPAGSSLPRARSWNPGDYDQPFGGISLSEPSVEALTQKVKPWRIPEGRIPEARQAELLDTRFGGTLGKPAPSPSVDVGISDDSLDALAKRLGLMKDKPF
jgi:hypothetical protein